MPALDLFMQEVLFCCANPAFREKIKGFRNESDIP